MSDAMKEGFDEAAKSMNAFDEAAKSMNAAQEWEEVEVEVRPRGTEVVSFRLPSQEVSGLIEAAQKAGETLSEYIRGALAIRMLGTPIGPVVELNTSGGQLRIRSHIVVDST